MKHTCFSLQGQEMSAGRTVRVSEMAQVGSKTILSKFLYAEAMEVQCHAVQCHAKKAEPFLWLQLGPGKLGKLWQPVWSAALWGKIGLFAVNTKSETFYAANSF